MTAPSTLPLPPPKYADSLLDSNPACASACQQQRVDAVHITGDDSTFYVLSEFEQQRLMKAINGVEALIKEFQQIVQGAPQQPEPCVAGVRGATEETCGCQACQKRLWARKAEQAGLLSLSQARVQAQDIRLTTDDDVQGRIADLKQRREQFAELCGWFSSQDTCVIGEGVGKALDAEIASLKARLAAVEKMSASSATATLPNTALGAQRIAGAGITQARSGNRVVEVIVLSRPDRRYYISRSHADELRQSMRVQVGRRPATAPLDAAGLKARATELMRDIQQQISRQIKADLAKPLGNLEARLKTWTAPEDCAANALHKEFDWTSDASDLAPYAVSTEAHLLRFAAQASVGFSGFDPKAGAISLGIKGQASFALGEGKITFAAFLPSQGGRDCYFSYKNAEGHTVYHRFGAFRLRGALELSCFAGVVAAGSATAGVKWKEAPSGASALLLSPELESRGGAVQVKGSLFAGAQAGGALTGGLEWMAPDQQNRENAQWAALLEVKTEGNVAFGAGVGWDFNIMLTSGKLYFHCKGELVFGPGAGGGFGTLVDFEKIAELVGVVYQTLSDVDFRYLLSINEDAFILFYRGVSQLLSEPGKTLNEVMGQGPIALRDWWENRSQRMETSHRLAERILSGQSLRLGSQLMPLSCLPPEVLGPALYMLSESYIFRCANETEKAIVRLLQEVSSWRQFYLVLERMDPTAQVVPAVDSVKRIRSYLSGRQARDFSNFIKHLASRAAEAVPGQPLPQWLPWQPMHANDKFETLLAARESWKRPNEGGRYV